MYMYLEDLFANEKAIANHGGKNFQTKSRNKATKYWPQDHCAKMGALCLWLFNGIHVHH